MSNFLASLAKFTSDAVTAKNVYEGVVDSKSIASITKQTSVEPFCVVSRSVVNLEYIPDVDNVLLSMFISYYLQGVASLVSLRSAEVRNTLKALGTNFSLEDRQPTSESLRYGLPTDTSDSLSNNHAFSTEAVKNISAGSENSKAFQTPTNMAIGKLVEIEFSLGKSASEDKERTTKIPIVFRLAVNVVGTKAIESLLVRYKEDIGFIERWHSWRSGRISFWRDLVFANDLIKENIKSAIDPENDVISSIDNRVLSAAMKNSVDFTNKVLSGATIDKSDLYSFGIASNLYVISSQEAAMFENMLGDKLTDQRTRDKLFGNGYAMILAVVDIDRERVKFYVQGADSYTDLSVKEVRTAAKGKGPDLTDIMKMMQLGTAPTF